MCCRSRPSSAARPICCSPPPRPAAPINIKKGQFLAPWDMKQCRGKRSQSTGNRNILLCERGVSFGYNTLVSDMRALPILAETGYPVVFDATHSVQQPGGQGTTTGGQRDSCRCWRARRSRSASPRSSWKRIRTPTTRPPTGPTWCT